MQYNDFFVLFQVAVALLHKYQELKALGHPDFQCFKKTFRRMPTNDVLQHEVCEFRYTEHIVSPARTSSYIFIMWQEIITIYIHFRNL